MKHRLKVSVLVDAGTISEDDPEFRLLTENQDTEHHVIDALRNLDHEVSIIGVFDDINTIIEPLRDKPPDVVFNLTEQFRGIRQFDKNITALLELIQIPFTGTGTMGLLLSRDKRLCKQLLGLHKIRVPNFISLPFGRSIRIPKSIGFPLVVKPALEDSSEGISNRSLVYNESALKERAEFIHENWKQDVIAEEYIEGRECYISILGNKRLKVLPIRECIFDSDEPGGPDLATYRVKWNREYREKWGIRFGFADLTEEVTKHVERVCKRAFRVLHLRDYCRIDLRIKEGGKLAILEANANPDLAYGEEVAEAAAKGGISYEELIARILRLTLQRHKESN